MKWKKVTLVGGVVLAALLGVSGVVTRNAAHHLVTYPRAVRKIPALDPAAFPVAVSNVTVTTVDGLRLAGWYFPSRNGATIIAQHGFKSSRGEMLHATEMLTRHGYGVLISSIRAHDVNDGEQVTFGHLEMRDLDAWWQWLVAQPGVDAKRIGLLGNSLGGSLVIQFAARNPGVRAVAADSAFSSLDDTVAVSIRHITGLPAFPFAPMVVFWARLETGLNPSDISAKRWIQQLGRRPVFLMQGGADVVVSRTSGQVLYDAASEPKELWYAPTLGHCGFAGQRPKEYEERVAGFFDKYLAPVGTNAPHLRALTVAVSGDRRNGSAA